MDEYLGSCGIRFPSCLVDLIDQYVTSIILEPHPTAVIMKHYLRPIIPYCLHPVCFALDHHFDCILCSTYTWSFM